MPAVGSASAADAAGLLDAALDHLAATDWASLGTQAHGEMLARLQRAQAKLTAVNAAVLAAFTAQGGYEPDGHKSARADRAEQQLRAAVYARLSETYDAAESVPTQLANGDRHAERRGWHVVARSRTTGIPRSRRSGAMTSSTSLRRSSATRSTWSSSVTWTG
jgi:hypothetical protein